MKVSIKTIYEHKNTLEGPSTNEEEDIRLLKPNLGVATSKVTDTSYS